MNYLELQNIEEAFYSFLRKINRKNAIRIRYYEFEGVKQKDYCALIGYVTSKGDLHGIHFSKMRNSYYFGTRTKESNLYIVGLTEPQSQRIPDRLKEGFWEVVAQKKGMTLKKIGRGNGDINDRI